MASIEDLEKRVVAFGLAVVERRITRLEKRRFVLCPFLRVRLLMRKLRFLKK